MARLDAVARRDTSVRMYVQIPNTAVLITRDAHEPEPVAIVAGQSRQALADLPRAQRAEHAPQIGVVARVLA